MVLCTVPPMTLSSGTQMLSLETESADWTGGFLLEQCPASLLTLPVLLKVRVILPQSQTVLRG